MRVVQGQVRPVVAGRAGRHGRGVERPRPGARAAGDAGHARYEEDRCRRAQSRRPTPPTRRCPNLRQSGCREWRPANLTQVGVRWLARAAQAGDRLGGTPRPSRPTIGCAGRGSAGTRSSTGAGASRRPAGASGQTHARPACREVADEGVFQPAHLVALHGRGGKARGGRDPFASERRGASTWSPSRITEGARSRSCR